MAGRRGGWDARKMPRLLPSAAFAALAIAVVLGSRFRPGRAAARRVARRDARGQALACAGRRARPGLRAARRARARRRGRVSRRLLDDRRRRRVDDRHRSRRPPARRRRGGCALSPTRTARWRGAPTHRRAASTPRGRLGAPFAGAGYATVAPDYLGLGDGPGAHPFMHLASETSASLDLLPAARELARRDGRELDPRVLVTGFSQGAVAALGLARQLQDRQELAALAPMSGPYAIAARAAPRDARRPAGREHGELLPELRDARLAAAVRGLRRAGRRLARPLGTAPAAAVRRNPRRRRDPQGGAEAPRAAVHARLPGTPRPPRRRSAGRAAAERRRLCLGAAPSRRACPARAGTTRSRSPTAAAAWPTCARTARGRSCGISVAPDHFGSTVAATPRVPRVLRRAVRRRFPRAPRRRRRRGPRRSWPRSPPPGGSGCRG